MDEDHDKMHIAFSTTPPRCLSEHTNTHMCVCAAHTHTHTHIQKHKDTPPCVIPIHIHGRHLPLSLTLTGALPPLPHTLSYLIGSQCSRAVMLNLPTVQTWVGKSYHSTLLRVILCWQTSNGWVHAGACCTG